MSFRKLFSSKSSSTDDRKIKVVETPVPMEPKKAVETPVSMEPKKTRNRTKSRSMKSNLAKIEEAENPEVSLSAVELAKNQTGELRDSNKTQRPVIKAIQEAEGVIEALEQIIETLTEFSKNTVFLIPAEIAAIKAEIKKVKAEFKKGKDASDLQKLEAIEAEILKLEGNLFNQKSVTYLKNKFHETFDTIWPPSSRGGYGESVRVVIRTVPAEATKYKNQLLAFLEKIEGSKLVLGGHSVNDLAMLLANCNSLIIWTTSTQALLIQKRDSAQLALNYSYETEYKKLEEQYNTFLNSISITETLKKIETARAALLAKSNCIDEEFRKIKTAQLFLEGGIYTDFSSLLKGTIEERRQIANITNETATENSLEAVKHYNEVSLPEVKKTILAQEKTALELLKTGINNQISQFEIFLEEQVESFTSKKTDIGTQIDSVKAFQTTGFKTQLDNELEQLSKNITEASKNIETAQKKLKEEPEMFPSLLPEKILNTQLALDNELFTVYQNMKLLTSNLTNPEAEKEKIGELTSLAEKISHMSQHIKDVNAKATQELSNLKDKIETAPALVSSLPDFDLIKQRAELDIIKTKLKEFKALDQDTLGKRFSLEKIEIPTIPNIEDKIVEIRALKKSYEASRKKVTDLIGVFSKEVDLIKNDIDQLSLLKPDMASAFTYYEQISFLIKLQQKSVLGNEDLEVLKPIFGMDITINDLQDIFADEKQLKEYTAEQLKRKNEVLTAFGSAIDKTNGFKPLFEKELDELKTQIAKRKELAPIALKFSNNNDEGTKALDGYLLRKLSVANGSIDERKQAYLDELQALVTEGLLSNKERKALAVYLVHKEDGHLLMKEQSLFNCFNESKHFSETKSLHRALDILVPSKNSMSAVNNLIVIKKEELNPIKEVFANNLENGAKVLNTFILKKIGIHNKVNGEGVVMLAAKKQAYLAVLQKLMNKNLLSEEQRKALAVYLVHDKEGHLLAKEQDRFRYFFDKSKKFSIQTRSVHKAINILLPGLNQSETNDLLSKENVSMHNTEKDTTVNLHRHSSVFKKA